MSQRRLRVVKWLSTTPALGVCTLCSREFKVPMSALKGTADVLLRQEPDEQEDEAEDEGDSKEDEDDDDTTDDGYSV